MADKPKKPKEAAAYRLAKAHAVKEVFASMEGLIKEAVDSPGDPLYRFYQLADDIGFKGGTPVFQGGLPPVGFRNRTMKIVMDSGHTTFITMGRFLEIMSLACVRSLGETYRSRKSAD